MKCERNNEKEMRQEIKEGAKEEKKELENERNIQTKKKREYEGDNTW